MPCRFIQIPIELINYVKAKKLSGLQYSLWLFLYSLDPFGDRFVPIPSPEQIAIELNVCARSIQRAAQRLTDLDLFDFNVNTWCAKNTTSNKNSQRTKRSKCGQNDPWIETQTKRSPKGQKAPIDFPKTVHSKQSTASQTNTDKLDLSYKSETTSKQVNNQEPDLVIDFWVEDDIDSSTSLPNQDLKEGSNSAQVELKIKTESKNQPKNKEGGTSIEADLIFDGSLNKRSPINTGVTKDYKNNMVFIFKLFQSARFVCEEDHIIFYFLSRGLENPLIDLWDSVLYPEDPLCLREGYKDGDHAEEEEEKGDRSRENNFKIDYFDSLFRENNADSKLSGLLPTVSPSSYDPDTQHATPNTQIPRPWLISGKLDPKFVDWLAQKWSIKYGDNLHTARSNV